MIFFFGYEKSQVGKWSPVLYHNERPKRIHQPVSTELVEIREEFEPSFGYLIKKYPPPQEEIKMVRPIEGFTTKDGKFFEDESSAIIHETVYELTGKLREFLKGSVFEQMPEEAQDEFILKGLQFISENEPTVRRYLDVVNRTSTVESSEEAAVPVNGQPAEGTS